MKKRIVAMIVAIAIACSSLLITTAATDDPNAKYNYKVLYAKFLVNVNAYEKVLDAIEATEYDASGKLVNYKDVIAQAEDIYADGVIVVEGAEYDYAGTIPVALIAKAAEFMIALNVSIEKLTAELQKGLDEYLKTYADKIKEAQLDELEGYIEKAKELVVAFNAIYAAYEKELGDRLVTEVMFAMSDESPLYEDVYEEDGTYDAKATIEGLAKLVKRPIELFKTDKMTYDVAKGHLESILAAIGATAVIEEEVTFVSGIAGQFIADNEAVKAQIKAEEEAAAEAAAALKAEREAELAAKAAKAMELYNQFLAEKGKIENNIAANPENYPSGWEVVLTIETIDGNVLLYNLGEDDVDNGAIKTLVNDIDKLVADFKAGTAEYEATLTTINEKLALIAKYEQDKIVGGYIADFLAANQVDIDYTELDAVFPYIDSSLYPKENYTGLLELLEDKDYAFLTRLSHFNTWFANVYMKVESGASFEELMDRVYNYNSMLIWYLMIAMDQYWYDSDSVYDSSGWFWDLVVESERFGVTESMYAALVADIDEDFKGIKELANIVKEINAKSSDPFYAGVVETRVTNTIEVFIELAALTPYIPEDEELLFDYIIALIDVEYDAEKNSFDWNNGIEDASLLFNIIRVLNLDMINTDLWIAEGTTVFDVIFYGWYFGMMVYENNDGSYSLYEDADEFLYDHKDAGWVAKCIKNAFNGLDRYSSETTEIVNLLIDLAEELSEHKKKIEDLINGKYSAENLKTLDIDALIEIWKSYSDDFDLRTDLDIDAISDEDLTELVSIILGDELIDEANIAVMRAVEQLLLKGMEDVLFNKNETIFGTVENKFNNFSEVLNKNGEIDKLYKDFEDAIKATAATCVGTENLLTVMDECFDIFLEYADYFDYIGEVNDNIIVRGDAALKAQAQTFFDYVTDYIENNPTEYTRENVLVAQALYDIIAGTTFTSDEDIVEDIFERLGIAGSFSETVYKQALAEMNAALYTDPEVESTETVKIYGKNYEVKTLSLDAGNLAPRIDEVSVLAVYTKANGAQIYTYLVPANVDGTSFEVTVIDPAANGCESVEIIVLYGDYYVQGLNSEVKF